MSFSSGKMVLAMREFCLATTGFFLGMTLVLLIPVYFYKTNGQFQNNYAYLCVPPFAYLDGERETRCPGCGTHNPAHTARNPTHTARE